MKSINFNLSPPAFFAVPISQNPSKGYILGLIDNEAIVLTLFASFLNSDLLFFSDDLREFQVPLRQESKSL